RRTAGNTHGEVTRYGGPAIVVDHCLDDDQLRSLIVVRHGARLRLTVSDRARAVRGKRSRIARRSGLANTVRAGIQRHLSTRRLSTREVVRRVIRATGIERE